MRAYLGNCVCVLSGQKQREETFANKSYKIHQQHRLLDVSSLSKTNREYIGCYFVVVVYYYRFR